MREDTTLKDEGTAREVVNRIQKLRKKSGIQVSDPVEAFYDIDEHSPFSSFLKSSRQYIETSTKVSFIPLKFRSQWSRVVVSEENTVNGHKFKLSLAVHSFPLAHEALKKKLSKDDDYINLLQSFINMKKYSSFKRELESKSKYHLKFEGHNLELELGKDIFLSSSDYFNSLSS